MDSHDGPAMADSSAAPRSTRSTTSSGRQASAATQGTVAAHSRSQTETAGGSRRRKEEARRSMEEKAGKYAHLPVYNKEEEQRKAREREARLAQLFSGENVSFCFGGKENFDL